MGDFLAQGGEQDSWLFKKFMVNSWHLVFIVGNGSYIVKSGSNGETEWCSGCYVLVVGVSRVGFLVRFRDGAMYFFAIHMNNM